MKEAFLKIIGSPKGSSKGRRSALRSLLRQQSGQSRLAILAATALLCLAPFYMAGHGPMADVLSNKALASTPSAGSENVKGILGRMDRNQRTRYVRDLRNNIQNNPETLLNTPHEVLALTLPHPDLRREDGPAQIWQYHTKDCVIDIFFNGDKVVHYELRAPGKATLYPDKKTQNQNNTPDASSCIKTLVRI